ncbi:MAG: rane protein [Burkholderiaceae bacterium]|nr:rane protein [Burkholderiaceae bacterium]
MNRQASATISNRSTANKNGLSRRDFLKWTTASTCVIATPSWAGSMQSAAERKLGFLNLHTGESLSAAYWEQGQYIPEAMTAFNRLLRDHRTNEIAPIDNRLFDLLYLLHAKLGGNQPFHVISGFRSPESNAKLATPGSGVAQGSLHMKGQAVDIRLPQCSLTALREAALALHAGGVGYYPKSDFVHVDTGRVRSW